ncbi:MAG: hypothetical protein AAFV53_13780 [Myxococcota bacterium]
MLKPTSPGFSPAGSPDAASAAEAIPQRLMEEGSVWRLKILSEDDRLNAARLLGKHLGLTGKMQSE